MPIVPILSPLPLKALLKLHGHGQRYRIGPSG